MIYKFIILFAALLTNVYSQVSLYQFQSVQGTYQEITGGQVSTASGNDGGQNISLPFSFTYNGTAYSTARLSVNGWLEMGQTFTGTGWLNDLASTTSKPLLCPLWDDLYPDTQSEIRFEVLGSAPSRIFVVQWKMIRWAGSSGGRQNFQVRLYESTNHISFHYGQMTTPTGSSASIGINDQIGGPGHFLSITPGITPVVSSTVANNNINSVLYLPSGLEYHFIPPVLQPKLYVTQNTMVVPAGTSNQHIIRLQIDQVSPQPVLDVTSFRFHLPPTVIKSNILNARLYYTGNDTYFSTAEQFGETVQLPDTGFSISGVKSLINGTHYFWLAFDISNSAQAGTIIDAGCNYAILSGTGTLLPDTASPFGHRTVTIGLTGSYTIGTDGSYASLSSALSDLYSRGAGGHCKFVITASYDTLTESFPITLREFPGADSGHTVTIFKEAGMVKAITCSTTALFDFVGGSYYRIDGSNSLLLQNSLSLGNVIRIRDGSSHNIIRNCEIRGRSSSTTGGVIQFTTSVPAANSYNIIENCIISNIPILFSTPNTGIFATGSLQQPNSYNIIRNNEILNFHDNGIYLSGNTRETLIENNTIRFIPSSDFRPSSTTVHGIRIDNAPNTTIRGNKIYNLYSLYQAVTTVRGIFNIGSFGVPMLTKVYNNFISLNHGVETANANVYGIDYYGYPDNAIEIVNNSVFIGTGGSGSSEVTSYNIAKRAEANQFIVKNNILINGRNRIGNARQSVMYFPDIAGSISSDYNNIYWYGIAGQAGYWSGTDAYTLENWKTLSGQDLHSIAIPVTFTDVHDLHLSGSSVGNIALAGVPYPGISHDIDGELRSVSYPYIGADEVPSSPLPVEILSLYGVVTGGSIVIHFTTATETNSLSFILERFDSETEKFNYLTQTPAAGNSTIPREYSLIDESPLTGENRYRIKMIDTDGSFSYSEIVTVNNSAPSEYRLAQNYPNPFNPYTTISYQIPNAGKVTIKVYDVLGNLVATLIDAYHVAGSYSMLLNASTWSAGVYYYTLSAGNYSAGKKMLLLK